MKKFVYIISCILFCLVLLTGCGMYDSLQTKTTNFDLMDFYYNNYVLTYEKMYQSALSNISTLKTKNIINDSDRVKNLFGYSQKVFEQEVCVIACLDYFENGQNGAKLPIYEFFVNSENYSITITKNEGSKWKVVLCNETESVLELIISCYRERDDKYNANYTYAGKNVRIDVDFDRNKGILSTALTTKTQFNSIYQEVTAEKKIYELYSNIQYFDAFYDIQNSTGSTNGGKFAIEGYLKNRQGKLKFAKCENKNSSYDITSLKQSDLASALTNNKYSLIFEKNEYDEENQYSWKQYGNISSWNNLVG